MDEKDIGLIPPWEFPKHLHYDIQPTIEPYTVCLLYLTGENGTPMQCGCGTLVRYRDRHGILTAAHVMQQLQSKDEIALVLGSRKGLHRVRTDHVQFVFGDGYNEEASEPDIGIIRLSPHTVSIIAGYLSFVNLEVHKQQIESNYYPENLGVWVLMGFPKEFNQKAEYNEATSTHSMDIYALATIISEPIPRKSDVDNYDYYHAKVNIDETVTDISWHPSSFEGFSGGGIWQVIIEGADTGEFKVGRRIFSGVIYWQTDFENGSRDIKCHGRSSIYNMILPKLLE